MSRILDASISGTLTLQESDLQSNDTASKRLHHPFIMVTTSKTSKSSLHLAFRSSENSPTKYGHYQFRTTTSNDHPTLWTGWGVSLRCSTITLQPGRKRLPILAQHRIVAWPHFWTLVWPNFHLWRPFKNPTDDPITVNKSPNISLEELINALLHHWNIYFCTKEIYIASSLLCWNHLENPPGNKGSPRFPFFLLNPCLSQLVIL